MNFKNPITSMTPMKAGIVAALGLGAYYLYTQGEALEKKKLQRNQNVSRLSNIYVKYMSTTLRFFG